MRSARLYLLAFLLATFSVVGCGTEGGVGGGVIGFDPIANTPSVVSFVISPKTLTRNVTQTAQFSLSAKLSNGSTADATSLGSFSSSNNNVVTINGSGLATAVLPGTATITATIGSQTDTATFTVNPFVNRLFVLNSSFGNNSITVYDPAVGGDQTPVRTIAGNLTTLNSPGKFAAAGQELFVTNTFGNPFISVLSLHANGNVAAVRTLTGANTTLNIPTGVAVANGELFVANQIPPSIVVFPANASGNVAPIRTIVGASTLLTNLRGISVVNGEILQSDVQNGILGFPVNANGNVAPTRKLSGFNTGLVSSVGHFLNANNLFVVDSNRWISAFAPAATGNVAPLRTIKGPTTLLENPAGIFVQANELFVANGGGAGGILQGIGVFQANDNGDVAPTRTISGANTGLNVPGDVLIAPSI